jgi:hypothetical protein
MRRNGPVDIQALLCASLATLCMSVGCSCPDYDFDLEDEEVFARDVDHARAFDDPQDEAELCLAVCERMVYARAVHIDTCTLTLDDPSAPRRRPPDEDAETTSDPMSGAWSSEDLRVVGTIRCSGQAAPECIGGRRPQGHQRRSATARDAIGRTLAEQAHLEAASVRSFLELAHQLRTWKAPGELVARCLAAAEDERRHARVLGELARERGAAVPSAWAEPAPDAIVAAALHNATEGCVLETWAALLAHVQAERATTLELRTAFATIASDETRHAQLAWDLDAWFSTQLDADALEQIVHARADALAALPELAARQAATLPVPLGLPAPARLSATARDFARRLSRTSGDGLSMALR